MNSRKSSVSISLSLVLLGILALCLLVACDDVGTDPFFHTLTLKSDGKTEGQYVLLESDSFTLFAPVAKDGYTFCGWRIGGTLYKAGEVITVFEDTTADAVWKRVSTLAVDYGDGTEGKIEVEDGKLTLPRTPVRNGYEFLSWLVDGKEYGPLEEVTVDGDEVTVTAQWIKVDTVTIDYGDERGKDEVTVRGGSYTLPSTPVRENYTFRCWMIDGSEHSSGEIVTLSSDITISAEWTENEYLVLNLETGTMKAYTQNGTITLPRVSEREGYKFKCWLVDDNEHNPGDTVSVTSGTVIKADWTRLKSVVIDYSDGRTEKKYVEIGSSLTLPVDPRRSGYKFDKWSVVYGGTSEDRASGEVITVKYDTVITASWTENDYWVVTLDYDIDGVMPVEYRVQKSNPKFTIPTYTPTQGDSTFSSWMIDGVTQTAGAEITVDRDLTVMAKWSNRTYVTVTFDTDGGGDINSQVLREGEKVAIAANPSKTGYTFTGWIRDMDGYTVPFDPDTDTVKYDMTLRAQYKANTHTVTFKDGYSDLILFTVNAVYGEKIKGTTTPTRRGHTFESWKDEDGSVFDVSSSFLIDGDVTLYAVWKKNSYTITFNSNGGTAVDSQTKLYEETVQEPPEPTREGYTFQGWTWGSKDYDFSTPVEANMTLTAKWSINWYTVTYEGNGGTLKMAGSSAEYMKAVSKPLDPVRDGYVFKTWVKSDGSEYDFTTPMTEDITLTASWNPQVYFKSGDTVLKIVEVETGSAVSKPDNLTPQKECCIFSEWTLNGSTYDFTTPVTEHIELEAAFNPTVLELMLKFPKDVINVDTIEVSCEKQSVSFSFQDGAADGDYLKFSSSAITALKECDHTITVTPKKSGKNVGSSFTYTVTIKGEKTLYTAIVETSSVVDITPTITGESSIDSSYNKYVIPKISTKGGTVRYAIGDEEVTSESDVYPSAGVKLSVDKTIKVLVETTTIQLEKGETTVQKACSELFEALGARGPAGGYIFYERSSSDDEECKYWKKDSDGNWTKTSYTWNYMEVAPKELGEYIFGYIFEDGKIATINSLESINYARTKSTSVVKQYGDTPYADRKGTKTTTQYAAKACYDYSTTVDGVTYNDWYLPCVDQLHIIANKIYPKGLIAFADGYYWTTSNDERVIDKDNGESDALSNVIYIKTDGKYSFMWSYKAHVIPVRSF